MKKLLLYVIFFLSISLTLQSMQHCVCYKAKNGTSGLICVSKKNVPYTKQDNAQNYSGYEIIRIKNSTKEYPIDNETAQILFSQIEFFIKNQQS